MADFGLDVSGQGAATALGLGPAVAQNAARTQDMQEQVDQAVEKTKQMQIGTQEAQKVFDTQAYLSEKGLMPKSQALAELQLVLSRQGADDDEVQKDLAIAQEQFPEELDGQAIWRFYSALREKKEASVKATGQAFSSTGAEKDVNGNPFPKGTMIQESADSEGNQVFVHSNEPASVLAADAKGGEGDEKQWQKLGAQIQGAIKSRFGVVGQVGTTISRADRAINTLNHATGPDGMLTKQDLENISTDIAAIYQGGVPSITQITENSYGTTLTNLEETLRHYTGYFSHLGNTDILKQTKSKLLSVLNDMRNSGLAQIQKFVEMQFPFFKKLIESDPSRWEEAKNAVMAFMSSGLINQQGAVMPPTGAPTMGAADTTAGGAAAKPNDPLGIL